MQNHQVNHQLLKLKELVLRSIEVVRKHTRKLEPNWKGPYSVKEEVHRGTYKLLTLGSKEVPNTYDVDNLILTSMHRFPPQGVSVSM